MDETDESYMLRLGATYKKEMTHPQWEKLHAALRWIVVGDDSGIEPEKITTGADSIYIGKKSMSEDYFAESKKDLIDPFTKPKRIGTSEKYAEQYYIDNKRVSKEKYEEAQRKPK